MDLLRESILCVLFPPSLKHLGTVPTIIATDAFRREPVAEVESEIKPATGETTVYQLRVPDNVTARRAAARAEQLHFMADALEKAFAEVNS